MCTCKALMTRMVLTTLVLATSTTNQAPSPSNPRVITCPANMMHLLPLLKFIIAARPNSGQIKIGKIQQHFIKHDPSRYGVKLKKFRQLSQQAVNAGLLSSPGATDTKTLKSVGVIPGARYTIRLA